MKFAIISVTVQGQELAQVIADSLEDDPTIFGVDLFHKNVKKSLKEIFHKYDCILGIMASGIMIRCVCPFLENKTKDPAILIMDEKANHIISLLSGHYGGANEFALKIADITGADPVITTATDAQSKIGIDSLAHKYFLTLDKPDKTTIINQALVDGEIVELYTSPQFEYLFNDVLVKNSYEKLTDLSNNQKVTEISNDKKVTEISNDKKVTEISNNQNLIGVVNHNKNSSQIMVFYNDNIVRLDPLKLVVGLGARKGVSTELVLSAVNKALNKLAIPLERIDAMATAEPKKDEKGILEAAEKLGLTLEIVSLDELKSFKHHECSESFFVREKFGVPGVCEPAALIIAGENSRLIYRKKAFNKVTIAIAVSEIAHSNDKGKC